MKILGVIPARYNSSRLMGKPLADINGKPMIWHTYNQVKQVKDFYDVIVATDDVKIEQECINLNINVVRTLSEHKTGTDRVGEVASKIKADLYVNIQGDEPLIEPQTIKEAIKPFYDNPKLQITNLMTKIDNTVEIINPSIIKVVVNRQWEGVYLSRNPIPYPKGDIEYFYYKQVCVYGYKPEVLRIFNKTAIGRNERIEDIEILRFIENGYKVQYILVDTKSIAVDTPNDLEKVRRLLK